MASWVRTLTPDTSMVERKSLFLQVALTCTYHEVCVLTHKIVFKFLKATNMVVIHLKISKIMFNVNVLNKRKIELETSRLRTLSLKEINLD